MNEEEEPFGYIYLAENTINGKIYIGKVERVVWKWKGIDPDQKIIGAHSKNIILKKVRINLMFKRSIRQIVLKTLMKMRIKYSNIRSKLINQKKKFC